MFLLRLKSQTANTCPVDRISFGFIYQRRCPGGDVQKKVSIYSVLKYLQMHGNMLELNCFVVPLLQIKVRTKKKREEEDDDDEEEESPAVICEECGRSDRRHRLLVCIHCDSGYGI